MSLPLAPKEAPEPSSRVAPEKRLYVCPGVAGAEELEGAAAIDEQRIAAAVAGRLRRRTL